MKNSTVRRLKALETERSSRQEEEERSRQREEERSRFEKDRLQVARYLIIRIVLAFYVGGLKPDESPDDAYARALKYQSTQELITATENLQESDLIELNKRIREAELRLYAQVGIDAERAPADALFDAFCKLANQLPEQWLDWLRSDLDEYVPYLEVGPGTRFPIVFPSYRGAT
jgi:hypothetical protein